MRQVDFENTKYMRLIQESDFVQSVGATIDVGQDYGWVLSCAIGGANTEHLISVSKVSGNVGFGRNVDSHELISIDRNLSYMQFAEAIRQLCSSGSYPNATVIVNADGIGSYFIDLLRSLIVIGGVNIQEVRWWEPCSIEHRSRFANQRAMAYLCFRESIITKNQKPSDDHGVRYQCTNIPVCLDRRGRWQIMPRAELEHTLNTNTDKADVHALNHLAIYRPHNQKVAK